MTPPPVAYRAVRGLARLLLGLFYRRIEVVGRFPAEGGLVVAANHHNSVVGALLLIATSPRRLQTLGQQAAGGIGFQGTGITYRQNGDVQRNENGVSMLAHERLDSSKRMTAGRDGQY